jgi:L-iditol 2-dehydrogenase
MRAAVTVALGETRIEELPDPACGPGDVVCRVLACATCGSDVAGHYVARKLPAVLGHEPAGEVVEVGRDVRGVRVGERVAIHHHAPCGSCARCAAGHETLCARYRSTRLDPGGFAEYVRVGADLVGELLPLAGLDPVAATLCEPLGCALRAQARVPGERLLVVGAGASGLLHVAAAARDRIVFVREPDPERRLVAERWGAAPHAGEPVDAAMVCTSAPGALAEAAEALDAGGCLCLYATVAPGTPADVDAWTLFSRELTITASWSAGPADMRAALALLQAGAVPAGELITARFGLAETGAALDAQRSGAALKAVVEPWR